MNLQTMSRKFGAHHPYHPYDAYIHEQVVQTLRYLQITYYKRSKDGKGSKGHVIENFWYNKSSRGIYILL